MATIHPSGKSLIDVWDERGTRPSFVQTFNEATKPQPSSVATSTSTPSRPTSAIEMYEKSYQQADQRAQQAQQAQQEAFGAYQQAQNRYGSAYQAIGEMINPKQDQKFAQKEVKRERNRAIATALGNLFSNLAGGIMAASGKGLGYVPSATPNKPLARLTELEQDYLTRGEKFRTWQAEQQAAQAEREFEMAKTNYTAHVKDANEAFKERAKAAENVAREQSKIDDDARTAEEKQRQELARLDYLERKSKLSLEEKREMEALRARYRKKTENTSSANKVAAGTAKGKTSGKSDSTAPTKPTGVRTSRPAAKPKDKVAAAGVDIES